MLSSVSLRRGRSGRALARPGLTGHRKFRRLVRALGSPIIARGALELLWDSCYEAGEDYVGTSDDVEYAVGWTGERGVLTRALVEAGAPEGQGFLEPVPDVVGEPAFRVHDLWHHAPDYVAKRRQREMARQERSIPVRRSAPFGDGSVKYLISQSESVHTPSPSHSPSPSPKKDTSAEPAAVGASECLVEPFLEFPVVGDPDHTTWLLSEAQCAEWAAVYPGLDVYAQMRKALSWVKASPTRRKTARGMAKFLNGWLTRAVDRGGLRREDVPSRAYRPEAGSGRTCPHAPRCQSFTACRDRMLAEAKGA